MADIVCVGFACVDVQMKGIDVVDGHASIDFVDYVHTVETELSVGGDAVNESMVLSKLGCDVQLMSGYGDDNAGMFLGAMLERAGVDASPSVVHPTAKTGISTNLLQDGGERYNFGEAPSPAFYFEPDLSVIRKAKIVTLGSLFCPPLDDAALSLRVAKAAKEGGAIICADTMPPSGKTLDDFKEVLGYIDYFFPNDFEAELLTGETQPQRMLEKLLSYGTKNVILTLGPEGVLVGNEAGQFTLPAFDVPVVDTTGAGDGFLAGFSVALLDGKPLRDCCLFASATSACIIGTVGANDGIQNRKQVEACLQAHLS